MELFRSEAAPRDELRPKNDDPAAKLLLSSGNCESLGNFFLRIVRLALLKLDQEKLYLQAGDPGI